MAQLHLLDFQGWEPDSWQALLPQLPPERRDRVLRCRRNEDRMRSAGAGYLLQYALSQAGVPHDAPVARTPLGKPYLPDFPHVQVSLSHADRWVVCAVSCDPVGVDVELPRCTMEIARRFFPAAELEELALLPEAECRDWLNRLWTAREAFLKALGYGLTISPDRFTVHLTDHSAVLGQSLSPLPYRLHEYRLPPCRICLCSTEEKPELQILDKKSVDIP